jgi:hypothetical protein
MNKSGQIANMSKIVLFTCLLFYFLALYVFLYYYGADLNNDVKIEEHNLLIGADYEAEDETTNPYIFNIVTSIISFPWFLNTAFFIIPLILLALMLWSFVAPWVNI